MPDCVNDDDNQSVTSMGWGDKEVDGKKSDFLRFTELSTVSSAKCGKQSDNPVLVENWLCSSKEGPVTCRVSNVTHPEISHTEAQYVNKN